MEPVAPPTLNPSAPQGVDHSLCDPSYCLLRATSPTSLAPPLRARVPLANLCLSRDRNPPRLHRFLQDSHELSYATLDTFFTGLEGLIGPPNPNLLVAMEREHCDSSDSQLAFSTPNYGVTTTSEIEWWFVFNPERGLRKLRLSEGWPQEEKLKTRDSQNMRQPVPLRDLQGGRHNVNAQLRVLASSGNHEEVSEAEMIAARLCASRSDTHASTRTQRHARINPHAATRATPQCFPRLLTWAHAGCLPLFVACPC